MKISALPPFSGTVASGDKIPIFDASEVDIDLQTKGLEASEFRDALVPQVTSIAALLALDPTTVSDRVLVKGYYAENDGGGGEFYKTTDITDIDDGTKFLSTSNPLYAWIRSVPDSVLNVRYFGAKGDDITDDTTAIQDAVSALPATGGEIFFPIGVYRITSSVNPGAKPVILRGEGWKTLVGTTFGNASWVAASSISGSVIKMTGSQDAIVLNNATYRQAHIRDLAILGPGSGSTVGINFGLGAQNNNNWVKNVLVANFATGLRLSSALDNRFDNVGLRGCTTGILLTGDITNTRFYNCDVQNCTTGISGRAGSLVKFFGGLVQSNTTGISLNPEGAAGVVGYHFENIWSEGNTTGIVMNSTTGAITGTTFLHCRESTGYTLNPTVNNQISRLSIENCEWGGVTLTIKGGMNDAFLKNLNISSLSLTSSPERLTMIGVNGATQIGSKDFAITWASTVTPDWRDGQIQRITLTGNTTINAPSNGVKGGTITLIIRQDGTGGRTVTWGGGINHDWDESGNLANRYSAITLYYDGTSWIQTTGNRYLELSFPWVDVKAYGAVGDGTTNDVTAIQNAINAIPSTGGTLFFPPGTFKVNSQLNISNKNKLRIIGAGNGSALTSPDTVPMIQIASGLSNTIADLEISNMRFLGTYSPSSPGYGTGAVVGQTAIGLNNGAGTGDPDVWQRVSIHDCKFENVTGGIFLGKGSNGNISDNIFTGCLADIQFGSSGSSKVIMARNIIEKIENVIADDAIAVFGPSTDISIEGNIIDRKRTTASVTAGGCRIICQPSNGQTMSRITIRGNLHKNNAFSGHGALTANQKASIDLDADGTAILTDVLVVDNQIYNGMQGIVLNGAGNSRISVINNVVDTTQSHAINVTAGGTDVSVVGNNVVSSADRGINIDTTTRLTVKNNNVRSSTGLGIVIASTGALIEGNTSTGGSSDGLRLQDTTYAQVINNVLENNGAYGLNFAGTCTNPHHFGNRFNANTSGHINNLSAQITAAADDTTPSVRNLHNGTLLLPANTVPTAITALDDGYPGQVVTLQGRSNTNSSTIADGGSFFLSAAITMASDTLITLRSFDGSSWFEISRSVN